jgi:metal-sulfur cluster biosynthetic enzyme
MLTDVEIRAALRDCYDPELPCNIVDLGLIRSIIVTDDSKAPGAGIPGVPQKYQVQIQLILTHFSEEAEARTRAQILNRLAGIEAISRAIVTILPTPQWTPSDITPAGRRILGLDGNPSLVQIK